MAVASLSLAGCAGLGASKPPPTYDLTTPQKVARAGTTRGQLLVAEATALSPFDSDKIVVRPAAGQVAAMSDAQWSDRLPKVVQARMVQAFENANLLRAVGRPGDHIAADYDLLMDIRSFQIAAAGPVAEVEISVKIVSDSNGHIAAARIFRASVPAAATQGAAAVAALDAAFAKVATDIVLWTTKVI
ncbi:MAG TPA: ABC-type transport auxiliary lipoprotein family protein [Xanthobacteraceae bacterium]|nr:ABC-type transport auxiliary lipoprotein family protein [Xanthobacteraceae bacterium]